MPRIGNVEFAAIEDLPGAGNGYLAMYVARSERRPHHCEIAGVRGYYRRSLASSRMMEHFEIEDAFRSFLVPELQVDCSLYDGETASGPMGSAATIGIELSLKNISNVSASFPYICVDGARPRLSWDAVRPVNGISQRVEGQDIFFEGDANCVINPSVSRVFGRVRFNAPFIRAANGPRSFALHDLPPMTLRCLVGCKNVRQQLLERTFSSQQLAEAVRGIVR